MVYEETIKLYLQKRILLTTLQEDTLRIKCYIMMAFNIPLISNLYIDFIQYQQVTLNM